MNLPNSINRGCKRPREIRRGKNSGGEAADRGHVPQSAPLALAWLSRKRQPRICGRARPDAACPDWEARPRSRRRDV
ncbi:unnamed protein product [Urochloa humidicola]